MTRAVAEVSNRRTLDPEPELRHLGAAVGLRFGRPGEGLPPDVSSGQTVLQHIPRNPGSEPGIPRDERNDDLGAMPMTPEQSVLARRRLWLGITNVGFWVLASAAGLGWLAVDRDAWARLRFPYVAAGILGVQAVFDVVGGRVLMPAPRPSLPGYLRVWVRGVMVHSLVLAGVGAMGWASLRWTGGFCAGVAVSSVVLALGRRFLHGAVSGAPARKQVLEDGRTVLVSAVDDPGFTGGIVGFGRRALSLLPEGWNRRVPRTELVVELFRRRWQAERGLPGRAFLLLLGWNLLGAWVGSLAFHLGVLPAGPALLGLACWMTLWTFVSLLVLPVLGRGTVLAADRAAADARLDPAGWIRLFPEITGEDGSGRAVVQNIFYPIPSADLRLRSLGQRRRGWVLGNLARGNLYQSLAGFTLLGRAVHCNVGRPALWVFAPSV